MQTDKDLTTLFSGSGWSIAFADGTMSVTSTAGQHVVRADEIRPVDLKRSWWRWTLHVDDDIVAPLNGLRRRQARSLTTAMVRLKLAHFLQSAGAAR